MPRDLRRVTFAGHDWQQRYALAKSCNHFLDDETDFTITRIGDSFKCVCVLSEGIVSAIHADKYLCLLEAKKECLRIRPFHTDEVRDPRKFLIFVGADIKATIAVAYGKVSCNYEVSYFGKVWSFTILSRSESIHYNESQSEMRRFILRDDIFTGVPSALTNAVRNY